MQLRALGARVWAKLGTTPRSGLGREMEELRRTPVPARLGEIGRRLYGS